MNNDMKDDQHSLEKYLYNLPDDKIAKYPLANREDSKLLYYSEKGMEHYQFKEVEKVLPKNSLLFFNNTKVISARLIFQKSTGARIEIFLTDPIFPHNDFQLALDTTATCTWKCMIGNAKKWKGEVLIKKINNNLTIKAELVDKENGLVKFTWQSGNTFLEIIETAGHVPLPPYLNRKDELSDKNRYQTVFSELDGAVAAPTAGLHFTKDIIQNLISNNATTVDYLTLHVSAGTFRPVKEADYTNHQMHNERVIITRKNIENVLNAQHHVIAVGTTAMRTLESTYWYGAKLLLEANATFLINKLDPYEIKNSPSRNAAFQAIINKMDKDKVDFLKGETEIFIFPGYDFKVCTGLFTNYHQPGSTLILLVAAFVGEEWRDIYKEALENDYSFLSYGDTSLLLK